MQVYGLFTLERPETGLSLVSAENLFVNQSWHLVLAETKSQAETIFVSDLRSLYEYSPWWIQSWDLVRPNFKSETISCLRRKPTLWIRVQGIIKRQQQKKTLPYSQELCTSYTMLSVNSRSQGSKLPPLQSQQTTLWCQRVGYKGQSASTCLSTHTPRSETLRWRPCKRLKYGTPREYCSRKTWWLWRHTTPKLCKFSVAKLWQSQKFNHQY